MLPSAPLLLLAVWDGVDGQEGQGEREIPGQVERQCHEIKRNLCNLLELEPILVFKKIVSCKFEWSETGSYY
jgi:hypothetical protein